MSKLTCKDCGDQFPNSNRTGHCTACCRTFVGLTAFDAHRTGAHGTPERRCELTTKHWQDERGYWHHGHRDPRDWKYEGEDE